MSAPYPHERRIQRFAWAALILGAALGAAQLATGDRILLTLEVPAAVTYGVLAAGFIVGAIAIERRIPAVALAAAGIIVLAILPAGELVPDLPDYALGLGLGVALLVFAELVHMTARYERAHKAVEKEGVPEDHINRVTDEAVRTLTARAGMGLGLAALAVLGAYALAAIGPGAWRAGVETTAPLGVALVGLLVLGALSLVILLRGARLPRPRSRKASTETDPDAE